MTGMSGLNVALHVMKGSKQEEEVAQIQRLHMVVMTAVEMLKKLKVAKLENALVRIYIYGYFIYCYHSTCAVA